MDVFWFILGLVCGMLLLLLIKDVSFVSAGWARLRNGRVPRLTAADRQHIEDWGNRMPDSLTLHLAGEHRVDLDEIEDAKENGTLDALHRAAHLDT